LDKPVLEIQQSLMRHSSVIGVLAYDHADFEECRARVEKIKVSIVGVLHHASDIAPEVARNGFEFIR
jgi:hypothetical protein